MNSIEVKSLSNEELARLIIKADAQIGRRFQPVSRSRTQVLWNEWQSRLLDGRVNCHPEDMIK